MTRSTQACRSAEDTQFMQVARVAASAVAFSQSCSRQSSHSAQAVALAMSPVDADKLLRFLRICPRFQEFKKYIETELVISPESLRST